jgi:hypothetical protein
VVSTGRRVPRLLVAEEVFALEDAHVLRAAGHPALLARRRMSAWRIYEALEALLFGLSLWRKPERVMNMP